MSQKPRRRPPKLKLSDLLHRNPKERQRTAVFDELTGESDRAAALLIAAMLDRDLETIIRFEFHNEMTSREQEDLFSGAAPLAPFATKIRVCYALDAYGRLTRDNLLEVARIRNIFAHSALPVTFRTPQIRRACRKLTVLESYTDQGFIAREFDFAVMPSRERYMLTCFAVSHLVSRQHLQHMRDVTEAMKRQSERWNKGLEERPTRKKKLP